jgi:hypothetical protein
VTAQARPEPAGAGQLARAEAPPGAALLERAVAAPARRARVRLRDRWPLRRPDTPPEGLVLAAAQRAVDFPLLAPPRLPWGYYLAEQVSIPHHLGCVTLRFRSRSGGQWWLTQRTSAFSLEEEMVAAGERCEYVTLDGRRFAVSQSARIGEPVEWHWATSRQLICWEQDGRMCELEAVRGHAPALPQLLWVAARLRPAAPLLNASLCRGPREESD